MSLTMCEGVRTFARRLILQPNLNVATVFDQAGSAAA